MRQFSTQGRPSIDLLVHVDHQDLLSSLNDGALNSLRAVCTQGVNAVMYLSWILLCVSFIFIWALPLGR